MWGKVYKKGGAGEVVPTWSEKLFQNFLHSNVKTTWTPQMIPWSELCASQCKLLFCKHELGCVFDWTWATRLDAHKGKNKTLQQLRDCKSASNNNKIAAANLEMHDKKTRDLWLSWFRTLWKENKGETAAIRWCIVNSWAEENQVYSDC